MKPSEILDKAADIIIRDGWHQGAFFKGDPKATYEEDAELAKTAPCCQDGAVLRAAHGTAWPVNLATFGLSEKAARRRANKYMAAYTKEHFGTTSPIAWNDLSSTTADDVVAALRGAANNAREAGE